MGVNMDSIIGKAKTYMNGDGRDKINSVVANAMAKGGTLGGKSIHTPEETAAKLLEVLQSTIASSGLTPGAMGAVSDWATMGSTRLGDNSYYTGVKFVGNPFRFSLDVQRYGGVDNIVALFNNGAKNGQEMQPVHGTWNGNETWSRTVIPGTHFLENAASNFMANYGNEYNVVDITVNI